MTRAEIGTMSGIGRLTLLGGNGARRTIASLAGGTATVIVFVGNGCPTVRAYEDRLMSLQEAWHSRGVNVVAVNANNPFLSPPDTLAEMTNRATARGFNFPYLKDEGAAAAKRFGAICTPHAFVLDRNLVVVYSGRIDDSRVGNKITSRDLENAVALVVSGREVALSHTEPLGCSIVW